MDLEANLQGSPVMRDEPSVEERRALIRRIAASSHFSRSTRLRDFLLYVGGQSLKPGCPEINEQEIGARVFGRSASYDRSQDNIVRVNATELRKRIDAYFANEGSAETLLLEIPRGGYRPVFSRRHSAAAQAKQQPTPGPAEAATDSLTSAAASPTASHPTAPPANSTWRCLLWPGLATAFAVLSGILLYQNRTLRQQLPVASPHPAVAAFWAGFFRGHDRTDIVLPDDSVSLIEDIIHHPIPLGDYLNSNYMRQIQSSDISPDRKLDLDQVFSHNLVTFGGVLAAQHILMVTPATTVPHLALSRYYLADDIKHNNVILIGGRKANPWVHLFDGQVNFVTDYDSAHGFAFIGNQNPHPGELATYPVPTDPNGMTGYTVIAYLPNPTHTANALILAGTDSDATNSAAEFLTSEPAMEHLQQLLHHNGGFPYFEVLLKTSRLSGTALNSQLVAYRAYADLP